MLMFGTCCLRNASKVKSQRQFSHMFHFIDKDESLLSVAIDIEVLQPKLTKIALTRRLDSFLNFRHLDGYFSFIQALQPNNFPKKQATNYFEQLYSNVLLAYNTTVKKTSLCHLMIQPMARVTLLCGCSDVYEHQHLFSWGVN